MDIKDLNKPQLILLALLLSFVASIATSITTVTLMQQAPPSVIAPINRVIQQTIEKIEQVEGKTVTQTVVIKEEDLVVDAIAKNQSAAFTIFRETTDELGALIEVSEGRGFALNTEGIIVADAALVSEAGTYYAKNDSGKFKAEFLSSDKKGFSTLKVGAPLDSKNKLSFTVPTFGDLSKMKTGQKILVLGGGISTFVFEGNKDLKLNPTKSNAGAMVINLDGEVIGMSVFNESIVFVPINSILDALKPVPKTP